ncbi:hypothetical protein HIM_00003 [Hirsutella minnesotensis 3608]|nr:hypothetical protein HIM_00003 [Hirsutella minnesotensis 3608]
MAAPMRIATRSPGSSQCLGRFAPRRRCLTACSSDRAIVKPATRQAPEPAPSTPPEVLLRFPQQAKDNLSRPAFDATGVRWIPEGGDKKADPNKAKLGKTLRILQERLPTLLQSPLPQEILAPNISLQLFPTTHPHLPVVSGRVAYNAALWTSPIAWNRVPIIGNVKLEILAERVTSEPLTFIPRKPGAIPEQLVVRWCEKRRTVGDDADVNAGGIARTLFGGRGVDPNKAFTGLFTFDFDAEGRILTHTIEQAQDCGNWEKGMGARFVGLTDWLLGGMRNPNDTPIPMFENLKRRR